MGDRSDSGGIEVVMGGSDGNYQKGGNLQKRSGMSLCIKETVYREASLFTL